MTVGSVIELYTTLIGWGFYDNFWDLFVGTGIAYIPFLVIVVKNFAEGYRGRPGDGAEQSVRAMELDIVGMMFVIVLAAQPTYNLIPKDVEYTPPCTIGGEKGTKTYTNGDGQSTYDITVRDGASGAVEVPIWWVAVMSVSSGANHAMLKSFDCMADLRAVRNKAASANISDERVSVEYDQFYSQCWVPADAKHKKNPYGIKAFSDVDALAEEFGGADTDDEKKNWLSTDLNYLGSHTFLEVPGFYDKLVPPEPPPGIEGKTCKEWWEGSLKQDIVDQAQDYKTAMLSILNNPNIKQRVKDLFPWNKGGITDDYTIMAIQNGGPPSFTGTGFASSAVPNSVSIASGITIGTAMFGAGTVIGAAALAAGVSVGTDVVGRGIEFYITMYLIREAAPMVQAFVLMAIYAFLPALLVFSGFRFMPVLTASLAIFTVKFWSVLWFMAAWIDANLTSAMYGSFVAMLANGSFIEGIILDVVSMSLYLGLPLLFTIVMAWGTVSAGNDIGRFMGKTATGASGGARGAAGKAGKSARSGFKKGRRDLQSGEVFRGR